MKPHPPASAVDPVTHLTSFAPGLTAVVVGASGGIGRAFTDALLAEERVGQVIALSRSGALREHPKLVNGAIDAADETSVEGAAATVRDRCREVDLVLIAIGLLQDEARGIRPERTWRAVEAEALIDLYRANAVGPALVAKHFLPLLARGRRSAFAALSARVGSIGDNRLGGWHGYRASKAALNMLIRCFALELRRRNPDALCIGLHPGTVDTALSAPFQANVPDAKLFSPTFAAGALLDVIDRLGPADSGGVFAWDGARVPP